jgi:hypothetical protein
MRSRRHHRTRAPIAITMLAALALSACGSDSARSDGHTEGTPSAGAVSEVHT